MEKVKKTFIKILPIVFISDALSTVLSSVAGYLPFGGFVFWALAAPFYIGLYRYCFDVIDGKNPEYTELLRFYRSADGWVRSAAAYLLGDLIVVIVTSLLSGLLILLILLDIGGSESARNILYAICFLVFGLLSSVFLFTPFIYALNPENGLKAAVKSSLQFFVKYILAVLVFAFIQTVSMWLFSGVSGYIFGAVFRLAKIYFAYFIIEKNGGNTSEND